MSSAPLWPRTRSLRKRSVYSDTLLQGAARKGGPFAFLADLARDGRRIETEELKRNALTCQFDSAEHYRPGASRPVWLPDSESAGRLGEPLVSPWRGYRGDYFGTAALVRPAAACGVEKKMAVLIMASMALGFILLLLAGLVVLVDQVWELGLNGWLAGFLGYLGVVLVSAGSLLSNFTLWR